MKTFADDTINVAEKVKIVLGTVKNIVGKDKMLVTFSHNVFKGFYFKVIFYPLNTNFKFTFTLSSANAFNLDWSKFCRLAHSHTMTPFDVPGKQVLLKTLWEKEKLLVTSNFSFINCVFYPFKERSAIFIKFKIVVCTLFQFGPVQNLSSGIGLVKS